jgi:hypothetical protein
MIEIITSVVPSLVLNINELEKDKVSVIIREIEQNYPFSKIL